MIIAVSWHSTVNANLWQYSPKIPEKTQLFTIDIEHSITTPENNLNPAFKVQYILFFLPLGNKLKQFKLK